jgi:hypothetical protein
MSFGVKLGLLAIVTACVACGHGHGGFGDDGDGGASNDASNTGNDDAKSFVDGSSSGGQTTCDIAMQHKSSIGCDYYSVVPGGMSEWYNGNCFAAYIANTSTNSATIQVTYNGQMLDVSGLARIPSGTGSNITYAPLPNGKLPAGQMAILF